MKDNRKNNFSWYDGWFFKKIIDPHQKKLRIKLEKIISSNSSHKANVIDIACGTGAFSLYLAEKGHSVIGVDLSQSMINTAKKSLNQVQKNNSNLTWDIQFYQGNAVELSNFVQNKKFDYGVITLAIHEMPEEERVQLLKTIKHFVKKLIISDYIVPRPKGLEGITTYLIEMIAGKSHFTNYLNFMKNGGVPYYLEQAGYIIEKEWIIPNNTIYITMAK